MHDASVSSVAWQVCQYALRTEEGAQAATQLLEQCPGIIRASAKQLQDKSARTRAGMFQVRLVPVSSQWGLQSR